MFNRITEMYDKIDKQMETIRLSTLFTKQTFWVDKTETIKPRTKKPKNKKATPFLFDVALMILLSKLIIALLFDIQFSFHCLQLFRFVDSKKAQIVIHVS